MATYEIHQFAQRGRAEPTRLALAAAGASFKNVVPQWPEEKKDYLFGVVPELGVHREGRTVRVAQSMAMLRHVARVYGMYGQDEEEHTQVDVVVEGIRELMNTFFDAYYYSGDKKESEMKKFLENLPKQVGIFEGLIAANGTPGHIVGSTLTIADIQIYFAFTHPILTETISEVIPENIKNVIDSVEKNEKIAAYLKSELRYPPPQPN